MHAWDAPGDAEAVELVAREGAVRGFCFEAAGCGFQADGGGVCGEVHGGYLVAGAGAGRALRVVASRWRPQANAAMMMEEARVSRSMFTLEASLSSVCCVCRGTVTVSSVVSMVFFILG